MHAFNKDKEGDEGKSKSIAEIKIRRSHKRIDSLLGLNTIGKLSV
jgi:hypothetical protein